MRWLRMLGIAMGMLATIGFGLCGAFGLLVPEGEGGALFKILGLIGLGLAALFGWLVRDALKGGPDGGRPPR
jgi:hypothetical protein